MAEKIAVIGSNSFSGAHFTDLALTHGAQVIGISRSAEPDPVFLPYKSRPDPEFQFFQLDLNRDLDKIVKTIQRFRPEYVVNFAAQSMVAESWQHPAHWFQTNLTATVQLHDELRRCEFLRKYVHVSTPEVYGDCSGLTPESIVYRPSTPYAVSRAAADMSLMSFFRNYGFPVVFTRSANVYGPGQKIYRIVPRAALYFLLGKKLPLHGGGRSVRSFVHIRDVAAGTLQALRKGSAGQIYHFSTQQNISIRALVERIALKTGVVLEDHVIEVADRPGKDAGYLLDSTKAREELGWADGIGLEQGLDQTISWVRRNLETLLGQPLEYIHQP